MTETTLGQKLRTARTLRGISLRKLAFLVNVTPTYISQVERDLCYPPNEPMLKKLAHELRIKSDVLVAEAGKIPSDIIAGMLEFPETITFNREYFAKQRGELVIYGSGHTVPVFDNSGNVVHPDCLDTNVFMLEHIKAQTKEYLEYNDSL